jgi:mRNA-degrading endonuclease RelE of RelBE toxin-antitoxin system
VRYDFEFIVSAADDLDKLVKRNTSLATRLITEHIPAIAREPNAAGPKKRGDLAYVRAYGFTFRSIVCRVAYTVSDDPPIVTFVAIGVHDEAYRRARGR